MSAEYIEQIQARRVVPMGAAVDSLTQQYTILIDDEYPVTYIGEAVPGTATSVGEWRIKKIDETTVDTTIKYAGSGAFSEIWDNRASLTYA